MKQLSNLRLASLVAGLVCSSCAPAAVRSGAGHLRAAEREIARAPKVVIVATNRAEESAWSSLPFVATIPVPGLSAAFPNVRCTSANVCLVVTGMGYANAASSLSALVASPAFDLRRTYFVLAGISGIDPEVGTLGSAAWAHYVVDYGLAHEVDARDKPDEFESGYFGIQSATDKDKPPFRYGSEVFVLDRELLEAGLKLSRLVVLADSEKAREYRSHYEEAAAKSSPSVLQCDTASGNTYWHGKRLGERARSWVKLMTDGLGTYCTTQQEDSASLEALRRGATSGRLDFRRIAVLRIAANFDRPAPGQSAVESLRAKSGGFAIAVENLRRVAEPLVRDIEKDWGEWEVGVPASRRLHTRAAGHE